MTSHSEDDWELDINFGIEPANGNHHNEIFQRKGVYSMEPDKELALACERYKYPQHIYLEDDDTNSSVTSGMSSKFSEIDSALNDLDDFMYDEPPSSSRSSALLWTPITNYDLGKFPGVVKKVTVASCYKEIQDNDDWTDDIVIPTKGMSLKTTPKIYDQQELSLDDVQDLEEKKEDEPYLYNNTTDKKVEDFSFNHQLLSQEKLSVNESLPSRSFNKPTRNIFQYEPEKDDEDDDMTGLDFPENMATLPKRLDEKKSFNYKPATNALPPMTKKTTKIPISTSIKSKSKFLSTIQRENDDDDFCDGLNIKEKAFNFSSSSATIPSSRPSHLPINSRSNQLSQSRNIKIKESTNFVSRLARPSPLLNNSGRQSDHAVSLAKRTNIQQLTLNNKQKTPISTTRPTFLFGTKASRQREAETAAAKNGPRNNNNNNINNNNNSSQYLTMNRSLVGRNDVNSSSRLYGNDQPAERKSANGYTLIARPKNKVTTYCSRLDNIDNLNDLRPRAFAKKTLYSQKSSFHPKGESKSDPERPWRKNMQSSIRIPTDRSKVKLIQPNEQNLKKEYNDMTYDDSNHCWRGNETSLVEFQDKPVYRRPMLIMNRQQKNAPSRYAAVVGSSMIFNTESQKWVSANGQGEECNELDTIEDLKDELLNSPSKRNISNSQVCLDRNQVDGKLKDFKLTVSSKRRMMFEQEQHESWIENWPMRSTFDKSRF